MPEQKDKSTAERDRLAFDLYARVVTQVNRGSAEVIARQAVANAETFLATVDKVNAGELDIKEPKGPQLSDVSAPNLSETHPHNLVSKRFGKLSEVNRINKYLLAHPEKKTFVEGAYNWDENAVSLARTIFPDYCAAASN